MKRVVLYHASDCHLCEEARAVLETVRSDVPFELVDVDIGGDATLEAAYRERIPVVTVDGHEAFTYEIDPRALRRLLVDRPSGDR